jgi:hypothetical protein
MLDCGVVPLVPPALARCPDRFQTLGSTPCLLAAENEGRTVAWTLTLDPGPARFKVLTVFVGSDHLRPVLRATDASAPWAAVAVCPRDVTGDGLTDLVVTFQLDRAPAEVDVEAVELRSAPRTVHKLETTKRGNDDDEGCRSPLVQRLRLDGDGRLHTIAPSDATETDPRPAL